MAGEALYYAAVVKNAVARVRRSPAPARSRSTAVRRWRTSVAKAS